MSRTKKTGKQWEKKLYRSYAECRKAAEDEQVPFFAIEIPQDIPAGRYYIPSTSNAAAGYEGLRLLGATIEKMTGSDLESRPGQLAQMVAFDEEATRKLSEIVKEHPEIKQRLLGRG